MRTALSHRWWWLVVALWASVVATSCDSSDTEIRVRLTHGPTTSVVPERPADDRVVRFVYASVLSPERSTVPFARLAIYLTSRLGRRVEIVRRRTFGELNALLRSGRAEAGIVCSGAYAVGREQFALRLLLVPTVNGRSTYKAYVIARRDAERPDLESLRGSVFAFSDPLSNGGYRYVAAALHERGTTPDRFFGRTLFTYSHDNTIEAVRDGIADGGTVDSLIWDQLLLASPEIGNELVVIEQSEGFPINPVVLSPHASDVLARDLSRVLLEMPSNPAGREVLHDLGISGFVRRPESAFDPIVESWRELGVLPTPPEEDSP